jgi:cell division septal protein FtsQ
MARKKRQEEAVETAPVTRETVRRALRVTGWTLGVVVVVFGTAAALLEGGEFLSTDKRFLMPEAGTRAEDAGLTVSGLKNASEAAVRRVFAEYRGRSVANIDLEKRRTELRRVDWVREASVRRIWPNKLHVEVEERVPVAFMQVTSGLTGDFAAPVVQRPRLIDADGVILPARGHLPQGLPLLSGVRERDDVERRRKLAQLMLRVLDELKEAREQIGEVDVTDPENLRILYQAGEHQVVLVLGNERFAERLRTFRSHYEGIKDRLQERTVLDVSLEGQITLVDTAGVSR